MSVANEGMVHVYSIINTLEVRVANEGMVHVYSYGYNSYIWVYDHISGRTDCVSSINYHQTLARIGSPSACIV